MTLRATGVICGTTLQIIAPFSRALAMNPATSAFAFPSLQVALGIFACLITREAVANPRCVFVLPISSNRIMGDNGAFGPVPCRVNEYPSFAGVRYPVLILIFPTSDLRPQCVRDARGLCEATGPHPLPGIPRDPGPAGRRSG